MADNNKGSFTTEWAIILLALLVASISVFLIVFSGIMYYRWINYEVPQNSKKISDSAEVNVKSDYSKNNEISSSYAEEELDVSSSEIISNEEDKKDNESHASSIGSDKNPRDLVDLSGGKIPSSWPGIPAYNEEDVKYFIQWLSGEYPSKSGWELGYQTQMTTHKSGYFDMPIGESEMYGIKNGAEQTEDLECVAYWLVSIEEPNARVWVVVSPDGRAVYEYSGEDPTTGDLIHKMYTRIR